MAKLKVTTTQTKPNKYLEMGNPDSIMSSAVTNLLSAPKTPPAPETPPASETPLPPAAPTGPDYEKIKADASSYYDNQFNEYSNKAKADAEASRAMTSEQYGELLRQAYVSNMQNQKKMADNLTAAGIRGGGSETANLKLMTGYQNTRNKTNSEKQSALAGIDKTMNDNIFNFKMQNDDAKNAYMQQIDSESRQRDLTLEEWAREDNRIQDDRAYNQSVLEDQRAYDEKIEAARNKREDDAIEKQDKIAAYEARYSKYKDVNSLKKALKSAKTTAEKTAINKAIAKLNALNDEKKVAMYKARYSRFMNEKDLVKAYKKTKDPVERNEIAIRLGYIREFNKKNKK